MITVSQPASAQAADTPVSTSPTPCSMKATTRITTDAAISVPAVIASGTLHLRGRAIR